MTNQTKQTRYTTIKNAAKKYATAAMLALALVCPGYAGEYACVPKTVVTKNTVRNNYAFEDRANLAMVVEKDGKTYLAEATILPYITGDFSRTVMETADKKAAKIEALVKAEIAKGTNGLVRITGNCNEADRTISIDKMVVDGFPFNPK